VTEKWATTWEDHYGNRPSRWRFPLGTHLRATDMGGQLWKIELLDGMRAWMPRSSARSLHELRLLGPRARRELILRNAHLFIGDRYYWGGRSPVTPDATSGVDCSSLVNLAYRAAGVTIPRDAHEQWMRATPVAALQPADLIFLSEQDHPKRIVHVMMYTGDNEVIEGPGTGAAVRLIAIQERLKKPLDALAPGDVIDGQTVYFGSYLP
jgi:cell wall-associated NlpC family hydrolase